MSGVDLLARGAVPDRGLSRRQPRDRDPERAARHIVQAQLVAEVDRLRVATVLAADPDLHLRAGLAALGDGDGHQPPHTVLVDRLEGVARQDLPLQVPDYAVT